MVCFVLKIRTLNFISQLSSRYSVDSRFCSSDCISDAKLQRDFFFFVKLTVCLLISDSQGVMNGVV